MSQTIYVQARADYIESLAKAAPIAALEELVWNALDANAHEVKIDLVTNELQAVVGVRVTDDGTGIDVNRASETFGSLGGSWKRLPPTGWERPLHGHRGCGRFKAFALGASVNWNTTFEDNGRRSSWVISGELANPGVFEVTEARSVGPACGTEVWVTELSVNCDSLQVAENTVNALASRFAIYLKKYPNVRIFFNGIPVTPLIVQRRSTGYRVALGDGSEAKLEIIEWKRRFVGAGRLVFAGEDGFWLYEQPAGVRSFGIPYTAWYVSKRFPRLNEENALVMDELNPEVSDLIDRAKKVIRAHFQALAEEMNPVSQDFVREWSVKIGSLTNDERRSLIEMLRKSLHNDKKTK